MKITPDHLARGAYVYVRQSTADQLLHNHESRRRQYGLAERARQLGWSEVVVIDDDLGRSGGGVNRPGFERLLAAICEGRVGAVLAVEASRLARNGRDWHTLLEFCGLVGCLIADEDGLYDPRLPNDRLLLGMKGTMSEMELSILRQRSFEALRQKARRGELFLNVAVGFVKRRHDRIERDPDLRVREAIALVFRKFAEFQSVRQVHLWLRQEAITLPAVEYGPEGSRIVWKPPVYNTVHHMLTNPVYAGAYAFGRTGNRVTLEGGRKRVVRGIRREPSDWHVLLPEHHEGYITWAEWEGNQRLIADNANSTGLRARGSVRRGEALLAGLLRCGHCGRRLHVAYSGAKGDCARYHCQGAHINHGTQRCISFGALRVDQAVSAEVLRVLQPLGIEAALRAIDARAAEAGETRRQAELALEQARFEAGHARRQYDAVDPDNRLVAGELERRWNERLAEVQRWEERIAGIDAQRNPAMSPQERSRMLSLGADLERAWQHAGATSETRKRLLRPLLVEIVVRVEADEIILGTALAGRRPHATRSAQEPYRPASMDHRRVGRRADTRVGPADAGRRDRGGAQSQWQANRQRQHLDRCAGSLLALGQRHPRLSGWRTHRAGRTDTGRGRAAHRGEQDDGAAPHPRQRHPGASGLQRSTLGHRRRRNRRGDPSAHRGRTANSQPRSENPGIVVT